MNAPLSHIILQNPHVASRLRPARRARAAMMLALVAAIACIAFFGSAAAADERRDQQRRLKQLRTEISSLSQNLEQRRSERSAAQQQLAVVERDLARRSNRLYKVRAQLADSEAQLKALARKAHGHNQLLLKQREALRSSLQSAWMAGRHQELKLLLSQDSAAAFGRMLAYYRYSNNARQEKIIRYQEQVKAFESAQLDLVNMQQQLGDQLNLAEQLVGEVNADRQARAQAIAEIDREVRQQGGQLGELQKREIALQDLLDKLTQTIERLPPPVARVVTPPVAAVENSNNRSTGGVDLGDTVTIGSQPTNAIAAASLPRQPFRKLRGKLPWPSSGELRKPRFSRLKGVLIQTNRSADVRSVAYGQVVFADWLQHFGMLVVVDHGDGYLSLYGHNEVLLVDVGDQVTPGEVLARVGDSGGRQQHALYFELRHKARVLRPQRWLGRAG